VSAIVRQVDVIRAKGRHFSDIELSRIQLLLHQSEMSISEIAERMHCSRSAIASVNRKFQIRFYAGHRTQWSVDHERVEAL
jgi:predicted XRE-type DNA-binding protein